MHALVDAPIRINRAGRVRCEPGWRLDAQGPGWLEDHDLWFVWAGRGRMTISGDVFELRPGVCVWMRPGHEYAAEQDPTDRLGVTYVHFEFPNVGRGRNPAAGCPEISEVRDFAYFELASRRLIDLHLAPVVPGIAGHLRASEAAGLLRSLLLGLAADARTPRPRDVSGTRARHEKRMRDVISEILERPGEVPPVREMARTNGYSTVHFARVFKSFTGMRPEEFIIRARIDRARQLLHQSTLTVSEIAAALGYADVFFFSRQFKQRAGISPTRFRAGKS